LATLGTKECLKNVAKGAKPTKALAATRIVLSPLLRVGENLVGVSHLLEFLLRISFLVHIGVELARKFAVGALDIFCGGLFVNA
jgi:hypothetical protein